MKIRDALLTLGIAGFIPSIVGFEYYSSKARNETDQIEITQHINQLSPPTTPLINASIHKSRQRRYQTFSEAYTTTTIISTILACTSSFFYQKRRRKR